MNLSTLFINRPIGTTLLAIGLALAGLVAFNILPVASLPQIEFPTIRVQANLPGASPRIMASSVATPLERQIGQIAGITQLTSTSSLGSTNVTAQFELSRNIDGAARDVQAAINAAKSQLPANLPNNPSYRKVNPADAPIMILALTSDRYSRGQMYDAASTVLQQKLSQVEGIGQVIVGGGSLPAVRVELNPNALNKYGISLSSVANTLAAANSNLAKGQFSNNTSASTITASDQLYRAAQYRPLLITYQNGAPVRLGDVAEVDDSVENLRNAGLANNIPAIPLILFKQPNANIIKTIEQVRALMPELQASVPAGIKISVMMDRATTIRASLHDIEITLLVALFLVIGVVYLFLGNLRAMLIPAVAVPLSLLGTFAVMSLIGYSLDNLSLMAITIATGFVIDDAIVVLENISRHIEMGTQPIKAAMIGSGEVSFTVLSMSLSLIAVFIPILLMGGIVGRLFHEFAVTLAIAILMSLVVSLTVTPMMCAYILKSHKADDSEKQNIYQKLTNRMHAAYEKSLRWALQHSNFMLLLTALTILLNIFLFIIVPKGFFPHQDTGRIMASIVGDQDSSFQAMREKLTLYVKKISEDPAIANVVGFVGSNASNSGNIYITLKSLEERKISADMIINRLRKQLSTIPATTLYMQAAQDLVIGGRAGNAEYQYTLAADNLTDLNKWAPQVLEKLSTIPGIADVNSDQRDHGLQEFVTINRDTASRYGITPAQIDKTLYAAFGQSQVSTMYTAMNQYHVIMEVAPPYWQRPETLDNIYVNGADGNLIPLSVFTSFAPSFTLLAVNHQSQFPSATLSFNLLPGASLGEVVKKINQTVNGMHLPKTIIGTFQGSAKEFQSSLANQPYLIITALLAVYIVLGMLYESLIHPITILSTLPSAGVGALLALEITGTDLSIIALIGIILLIGIVKKNAIMMIDFALHIERTEKKSPEEAIYQGAVLRFRPIMMTTMAALLGALPLALNHGIGGELRRPLGIAVIGGLIVSQMLTLYTTPVIYLSIERGKRRCQQWRQQLFPSRKPIIDSIKI